MVFAAVVVLTLTTNNYSGTAIYEVPRDRAIYFIITEVHYKRNPDIVKLLKKYKKNFVILGLITCFQNVHCI